MSQMPKPQHCGQEWLAMQPAENGRRCGQCDKVIHDFSRMSWREIEQRQQAHGNTLCGMYSPAQLKHWGQEPPSASSACARLAAATTLALSLSSLPALAQTGPAGTSGITIRGAVYDSSKKGKPFPLPGVTVLVMGTQIGVSSNADGTYELSIPDAVAAHQAVIAVSSVGYLRKEFALDSLRPDNSKILVHDIQLVVDDKPLPNFYVQAPTLAGRMWSSIRWWTFGRWFGRNN